jgi:DNA-binding CsgD family transcriptional regulator
MLEQSQIEALKKIYDSKTIKIYGPYLNDEKRKILHINMDGKNRCRLLAAWLVEIKYNRKMTKNETVDHIDENKMNDSVNNLQILLKRNNNIKAFKNGRYDLGLEKLKLYAQKHSDLISLRIKGEKNPLSKVSNEKVKNYRELFIENKITVKQIMEIEHLNRRTVENFIKGRSYKDAGGSISERTKIDNDIVNRSLALMKEKIPFKKIAEMLHINRSTLYSRIKTYKTLIK